VKIRTVFQSLLLLSSSAYGAISLSLIETFDSPTTWQIGQQGLNTPSILPNSGPEGGGDFALLASSSVGGGPASRLIIFDNTTWTGDYSTAGVTGLRMDFRNTSAGNLFMRIAVNGPGGWFVTDGQSVNAGLGYASYLFNVTPAGLQPAANNSMALGTDVDATLAAVSQIRILHNPTGGSVIGQQANATLRIDNITAVPEPKATLLIALSLVFLTKRKR
jgi:hypothetical protein